MFEDCDDVVCLLLPGVVWIAINVVLVFIGSYMVTYHAVSIHSNLQMLQCTGGRFKMILLQL